MQGLNFCFVNHGGPAGGLYPIFLSSDKDEFSANGSESSSNASEGSAKASDSFTIESDLSPINSNSFSTPLN